MTDFLSSPVPFNYTRFLSNLKEQIQSAQLRASIALNRELLLLYGQIGQSILERQRESGCGSKVIDQLAKDLAKAFPEMKGFSARNLRYMRTFAEAYPDEEVVQRCVAQLPWRHNIAMLEKRKDPAERLWYADQAIENGWSRDVLVLQIETNLRNRLGGTVTNFQRLLPKPESDLALFLVLPEFDRVTLRQVHH